MSYVKKTLAAFASIALITLLTTVPLHVAAVDVEPDVKYGPKIETLDGFPQILPQLLSELARIIEARGWRCDSITSARYLAMSNGFKVTCNRNAYRYVIKGRGGQWSVDLK